MNSILKVLDVGQCDPDHATISRMLKREFSAQVDRAEGWPDANAKLKTDSYQLVLVNRKLDVDYSDGLDVIKAMKADEALRAVPVMLVSNYPEYQHEAVQQGALPGFGKAELSNPEALARIAAALGATAASGA